MSTDRNFDALFDAFRENIKTSNKGRLREVLLREDLQETVAGLAQGGLAVLDAGCGLGDMSLWLARMGHHVVATDLSQKMIDYTQAAATESGLGENLHAQRRPLQEMLDGRHNYDLICLHAVMEWLAQPEAVVDALAKSLKPSGQVSLSVYNLHRSVFNALVKGNFRRVLQGDFGGHNPTSLTPPHPIDPDQLAAKLTAAGFTLELMAGIRCFHDNLADHVLEEHSFDDLMLLERRYRRRAPYRDMARYIHFVARRNDG